MAMKWPTMYFNTNPPPGYAPNKPVWQQMSPENVVTGKGTTDGMGIADPIPPPPEQNMSIGSPDQLPYFGAQPTQTDINLAAKNSGASGGQGFSMGDFTPYYQTPEYQQLIKQMEAARASAVEQQKAGIAGLEDRNRQYQNLPMQLDLSPLMNLSDNWFGGNLQQGYKRPETPQDRIKLLSDMESALLKARGGLSQEEQQYLQNRMGLMQKADETKANLLMSQAKMQEAKNAKTALDDQKTEKMQLEAGKEYAKDYGESIKGMADFTQANQEAQAILRKNLGRLPSPGSDDYALFQSAVARMITNTNRYVANLGALAGGDLNILSKYTGTSPESVQQYIQQEMAGKSGTLKTLENLQAQADRNVKSSGEIVASRFNTPSVKNHVMNLHKTVVKQYENVRGSGNTQGPKPTTVVQNGVEYTLNPTTGQYE